MPRKRARQPPGCTISACGTRCIVTLPRAATPKGTARSPIVYHLRLTPGVERASARKRRRRCNDYAEKCALRKTRRSAAVDLAIALVEAVFAANPAANPADQIAALLPLARQQEQTSDEQYHGDDHWWHSRP